MIQVDAATTVIKTVINKINDPAKGGRSRIDDLFITKELRKIIRVTVMTATGCGLGSAERIDRFKGVGVRFATI